MSMIAILLFGLLFGDRRRMIFPTMRKVKYGKSTVKVNVSNDKIGQVWAITFERMTGISMTGISMTGIFMTGIFARIIRKAAAATSGRINEFR